MALTQRQMQLLDEVVRHYRATGRPVGSRTITESRGIDASPSTVRAELHRLEQMGLLEHPHTSAGRVPTTSGYRHHVDRVISGSADSGRGLDLPADFAPDTLDTAIETVTAALTDATDMLAVATRPAARGNVIRHIEIVRAQPHLLVVVCITDGGDVSRHRVLLDGPVDTGLTEWAAEYLNEQLSGVPLGRHVVRRVLSSPELGPMERAMLEHVSPAIIALVDDTADVHIGGAAAIMPHLSGDVESLMDLVALLDERRRLLTGLRRMLGSDPVRVSIGEENELPELRPLAVVASRYGTHGRPVGIVGLIGPRRMDYRGAVSAVRQAADILGDAASDEPATTSVERGA